MALLQLGLWKFPRGNIEKRNKKKEMREDERAKRERGACWLCSTACLEDNAPVAATVHRGGWNTAADGGKPLTFVPFCCCFCLKHQRSHIHTRRRCQAPRGCLYVVTPVPSSHVTCYCRHRQGGVPALWHWLRGRRVLGELRDTIEIKSVWVFFLSKRKTKK